MVITFSWLVITRAELHILEGILFAAIAFYSLYDWKQNYNLVLYSAVQITLILYWILCPGCGMLNPILCYFIAKICEDMDREIYDLTDSAISGHTLKHLFSGLALFFMF